MKKLNLALLVVAACGALLSLSNTAEARAFRVLQAPNGTTFSCLLCHNNLSGGSNNAFGQQVEEFGLSGEGNVSTQAVVWANVAGLDADGDGVTNGAELGDPDGTWMIGDDNPATTDISDPTDPDDVPEGGNTPSNNTPSNNTPATGDDASASSDDGGCAVAPGRVGSAGLLIAVAGLLFTLRRRS